MSGTLLANITRVNDGNPLFQPFGTGGGGSSSTINTSSITASTITTEFITITSGTIGLNSGTFISTIGNQLFYYNGSVLEPFTTLSSISTIEDWAIYPAISSINADGNDILNANVIEAGAISSLILQSEEAHISTIYAREIFTSTLTALSTIQTFNIISTPVVQTDILYAQTGSISTLNTQVGNLTTLNAVGINNSNLNTSSITTSNLQALDFVSAPLVIASDGAFLINTVGTLDSGLNFLGYISAGIVECDTLTATGGLFAPTWNGYTPGDFLSTIVPDINISTITSDILGVSTNQLLISSSLVSCGVSSFVISNPQQNAKLGVNTLLAISSIVSDSIVNGNVVVGGTVGAVGTVASLAGNLIGQNVNVVGGITASNGPNNLSNATVIDSGNNDTVIQAGPLGAQGFRVSPLGVVTTASGYNTVTTGIYQSYTSGQYIDMLAGGTLTLSHGSAFGDNAVVVKNFANNANARLWFKHGGDVSSLTTLNTQDINATGTILGAQGAIQTFGVNTIVALTGGTFPILNSGTANISTLNVSTIQNINITASNITANQTLNAFDAYISTLEIPLFGDIVGNDDPVNGAQITGFKEIAGRNVSANTIDTYDTTNVIFNSPAVISSLTVSSIVVSGASSITLATTATAGPRGQPAGRALWSGQDLDLQGNDLWAQQIKLGATTGSGNNEFQLYNAVGNLNNYWAMNWSIQDRTVRVQNNEQGTGFGYMLDTTVNRPLFSTINFSTSLMAFFPSTTASTIGVSTMTVIPPIEFYASAYASTSQTVLGANTPTEANYTTETINKGGFTVAGSTITVPAPGTYSITHSAQFNTTSGGTNQVDFWIRKNGIDIVNSASKESVSNNGEVLGTIELIDIASAGDQYGFTFASSDANMQIAFFNSTITTPYTRPGIPSIITNIKRLGS